MSKHSYFVKFFGDQDKAKDFLESFGIAVDDTLESFDDGQTIFEARIPDGLDKEVRRTGLVEVESGDLKFEIELPDHWPTEE